MAEPQMQHTTAPNSTLVVEDDQGVCEMLSMVLELEGYDVTFVSTAQRALDILLPLDDPAASSAVAQERTPRPALILLDLQLPDMGGEEVIAHLQHTAAAPPIVIMSAKHRATLEAAATLPGVVAVLPKPFNIDQLLQIITTTMSRA